MVKKKVTKKASTRKFVFSGDPNDSHNPAWISMLGYLFKLGGAAIKVKDDYHANQLANNSHFTEK